MAGLSSRIEQLWWRREEPPLLLRLIEPIYAAASRRDQEKRAADAIEPPLPLISVGNITVGGSGKTPFVIWLADRFRSHGFRPVILCRGDGGTSRVSRLVTADSDPVVSGDEACLLAQASGCPVIAARDRIAGAQLAAAHGDMLILDDGFQYRQLQRRCDIVLVPTEGLGNGHLLPAGPLREPVTALERADLIVRSGRSSSQPLTGAREWRWQARPLALRDAMGLGLERPDSVFAAAAIARPERFFDDLESLGVILKGRRVFADHHRYSEGEVAELAALECPVVVTAKDAVKLAPLWPNGRPLWVLDQAGDGEPGLFEAILARVGGAPA